MADLEFEEIAGNIATRGGEANGNANAAGGSVAASDSGNNNGNTETELEVELEDSFNDNSDNNSNNELEVEDSFNDNSDHNSNNELEVEVDIEDSFNDNSDHNSNNETETKTYTDSFNDYDIDDHSITAGVHQYNAGIGEINFVGLAGLSKGGHGGGGDISIVNRPTTVSNSVNQNIWTGDGGDAEGGGGYFPSDLERGGGGGGDEGGDGGDVDQNFDQENVVASGENSQAAGDDAWQDNSSTTITVGDIAVDSFNTEDSYNHELEVDIEDSFNPTDVDVEVEDSFNEYDTDVDVELEAEWNNVQAWNGGEVEDVEF